MQPNKSNVPTEASNQPAQRPVNGGAPIIPIRSSIADWEYDSEICFWSDYDDNQHSSASDVQPTSGVNDVKVKESCKINRKE